MFSDHLDEIEAESAVLHAIEDVAVREIVIEGDAAVVGIEDDLGLFLSLLKNFHNEFRSRDRDHRRRRSRSRDRRRSRSRDRPRVIDHRRSPRRSSPSRGGRLPGPERRDVMPFTARQSPPKNARMDLSAEERDFRTIFVLQVHFLKVSSIVTIGFS